ncbi:hypothetical protein QP164_14375 [Sphingomonas sp. LR59]|uniref:hypothetical protein n=1 Tax=Sphingomonas sp. LR59 TaxID=3050232 RepID=UPI002FDFA7C5
MRAEKADLVGAIAWVRDIVDLLADGADASAFITRFARPADLDGIATGVLPTYFAVDTMALADAIWEGDERIRLVRENGGLWHELGRADVDAIIADLAGSFEVRPAASPGHHDLLDEAGVVAGALRFNKARIALRGWSVRFWQVSSWRMRRSASARIRSGSPSSATSMPRTCSWYSSAITRWPTSRDRCSGTRTSSVEVPRLCAT